MDDLWVPRSEVEKERKLRETAEKQLQQVLEFLDPQIDPDSKGGFIYGAPFPKSGDLAKRLIAMANKWEQTALDLRSSGDALTHAVGAEELAMVKELCKVIGAYRRPESETNGGIVIPEKE
jgi:hypothetical protein